MHTNFTMPAAQRQELLKKVFGGGDKKPPDRADFLGPYAAGILLFAGALFVIKTVITLRAPRRRGPLPGGIAQKITFVCKQDFPLAQKRENWREYHKKALSLLLCLALLFSLAPVEIHAAEEEPVTLDLAQGSIVISATGYAQDGGAETPYTGDYTIVQTDTTYVDKTISVTGGAHKITMGSKVEIDVHAIFDACAFSIAKGASVELVLTRSVTLKSGSNKAGLAVPTGAAVTISANSRYGALNATGGNSGAGIGGDYGNSSSYVGGNITILSGTVEATGGSGASGIGGYGTGTGKDEQIHISGGKVTATGGFGSAGIGGGSSGYSGTGENGQIIIDGTAVVTATGNGGAGIGGGARGNGTGTKGKIILAGNARVIASASSGAGIGAGATYYYNKISTSATGSYGELLITEDAVVEVSSNSGAGIGAGQPSHYSSSYAYSYGTGSSGKLTINGNAQVTATSTQAAGIGGGYNVRSRSYLTGDAGVISISGNARVEATGGRWGIGANAYKNDGALKISGGTVIARATDETVTTACGIGKSGSTTITGGTVEASGYTGIAWAKVNGGTVTATSLTAASGVAKLFSDSMQEGWVVSLPAQESHNMSSGVLFSGSQGQILGAFYELPEDRETPADAALTVAEDQELIVPKGKKLTVNGSLIVNGKLTVAGTLYTAPGGSLALNGETDITGKLTGKLLPVTIETHDQETEETSFDVSTLFTIPETAGTVTYTVVCKNGAAGTLTGTILSIQQSGTFEITAATAETALYQSASATAVLTAKNGALPHEHQLEEFEEKAPTCLEPGNIHYWTCVTCGKCFSDEGGTEIPYDSTIRAALGHDFHNGSCTRCGAEDPGYQTTAAIAISSLTAYPGDTIRIPVSIRSNPGISAMKLTITYDTELLEYQEAAFDQAFLDAAGAQTCVNAETAGKVILDWVQGQGEYSGSGDFAVLTLKVKAVTEDGGAALTITYDPEDIFNKDHENQTFQIENGTVQIKKLRPGDINGDGSVNINDALLLLRYVCELDQDQVLGNPDVTGDGKVNNKDVVTLLRFVAKLDGVVLH